MRIHQVFVCLLSACLPLAALAQTPADSVATTPAVSATAAAAPLSQTMAAEAPEPTTKLRKGQLAPGGYGPSARVFDGHFGFKIGPSLTESPIDGVSPTFVKRKLDFHLGVMYRYRFYKFVLQPELLFQIKGGTYQQLAIGSSNRITTENNFNYISVPLMLGYMPTEGLTLQAGPEFSFALKTPNGPQTNRDTGIAFGVHYDFLDMLDKFSLNVRYVYGLTKIPETVNSTLQNRAFQLSLVYNFYKK
ncbi:porin family protein [Fibrella aquatilis]|uniref:PorT family protein n=1 Tax=Fibrella aquatilis TaxID=2817059 RepID=A0A939JZL3_9BACT|nr:porin family protein [Fibrella aquatilis]MBO0931061.1 PorT family protein [Fibrella aquatilis]